MEGIGIHSISALIYHFLLTEIHEPQELHSNWCAVGGLVGGWVRWLKAATTPDLYALLWFVTVPGRARGIQRRGNKSETTYCTLKPAGGGED